MSFFTSYSYKQNGGDFYTPGNTACFSTIFMALHPMNSMIVRLFMHKKHSMYHSLEVTKEEAEYVFSRLSEYLESPVVTEKEHDCDLMLEFNFVNAPNIQIRFALTLARYFYESSCDVSERPKRKDAHTVIRRIIDYSRKYPEIPFIEVIQLMHYDCYLHGGHGLLPAYNKEYPRAIVSSETFAQRIKDIDSRNLERNLFSGFNHHHGITEDIYLNTINDIKRI
jgi:hypothetical protein